MAKENEDGTEKSEEPTAKRKSQSKKKGQMPQSQDLGSAVVLIAAIIAFAIYGKRLVGLLQLLLLDSFKLISTFAYTEQALIDLLKSSIGAMVKMVYPIMLMIVFFAIFAQVLQKGIGWYSSKLKPDFLKVLAPSKIIKGIKKIFFSKQSIFNLLKNMAKMIVIGYVVYLVMRSHFEELLFLIEKDFVQFTSLMVAIAAEIAIKVALLLLVLGIIDFIYQKRKHHDELKMTKQEVKDEHKMAQGDPKVLAKRKQMLMKLYQNIMMKQVPQATVVITNPTFLAIALRYKRGEDQVPIVLAKGKRKVAEKIRQIATESGVPIVENKPLARAMYELVEVGDTIPADFYNSVAEVLAFVMSRKGEAA
jgi:flagellar biosynthetic protein FlhB